jgi:cyclic dehypoxanthinyl futalosine synthase
MSSSNLENIYQKITDNIRISESEGLFLLKNAHWLDIAKLANIRKNQQVGEKIASYTVFAIINYTNICEIECSFCSYKKNIDDRSAYVLSKDQIFQKIDYAISQNADQIFFQGGVHPELKVDFYTNIISAIKEQYPIHIRGFSPVEIKHIAKISNISIKTAIQDLKTSGLDSVPGAGAEMLSDRVRNILSPKKCTTQEWCDILTECHAQKLYGSANIVFGSVETDEEIIQHLDLVRSIQDNTGGFNSFIPWTFQQQTKAFKTRFVASHDYLKMLGICRLYLDNIKNIEVSVMVLGKKIGGLALHMGANDISSPVIEENVLRSFGVKNEVESRLLISEAGFDPYRRDFNYESLVLQT